MATNATARPRPATASGEAVVGAAFALGALALAGEAAVHLQQYVSLVHGVRWIGPLFLANAASCVATVAGLASARTRQLAALIGVVISTIALGSLVVSYGRGLFGYFEAGFRAAIAVAVITEVAAVILLSTALALSAALSQTRSAETRAREDDEEGELARFRLVPWSRADKERTA